MIASSNCWITGCYSPQQHLSQQQKILLQMGNSWDCNLFPEQERPDIPSSLLKYDSNNQMMRLSYKICTDSSQGNVFEKTHYNWHSIPITTSIGSIPFSFSVENRGIANQNFLVGIITRQAIAYKIAQPWRTEHCICYESHKNKNESYIIHNNEASPAIRHTSQNETVKVVITLQQIQFWINKQMIGFKRFPQQVRRQFFLPYVVLFNRKDKIKFINKIQRQSNPQNFF